MFSEIDGRLVGMFLEGFFYGIYSGLFIMYLQWTLASKFSKETNIVLCALCLLYVLSTIIFLADFIFLSLNLFTTIGAPLWPGFRMAYALNIFQITTTGCNDCLAQCILIYRCWIVWGQNIWVVIIPSFLTITFFATWLATIGSRKIVQDQYIALAWGNPVILTSLALSMAMNTLVTGLIVFKILRVFLQVKANSTSLERALGSSGGTKFRHIIFIIIESGMALFAIQLIRITYDVTPRTDTTGDLSIIGIHQMLNGITPTIILVRVRMKLSFSNKESFEEAIGSLRFNKPPSDDPDSDTLRQMGSMLSQDPEMDEDICLNISPGDPDTLQRVVGSSVLPQEKSDDT